MSPLKVETEDEKCIIEAGEALPGKFTGKCPLKPLILSEEEGGIIVYFPYWEISLPLGKTIEIVKGAKITAI